MVRRNDATSITPAPPPTLTTTAIPAPTIPTASVSTTSGSTLNQELSHSTPVVDSDDDCGLGDFSVVRYGVQEMFPHGVSAGHDEVIDDGDESDDGEDDISVCDTNAQLAASADARLPWEVFRKKVLTCLEEKKAVEAVRVASDVCDVSYEAVALKWKLPLHQLLHLFRNTTPDCTVTRLKYLKMLAGMPRSPHDLLPDPRSDESWEFEDLDMELGGADPMAPTRSNMPVPIPEQTPPEYLRRGVDFSALVTDRAEFERFERITIEDSRLDGEYAMMRAGHHSRRKAFSKPWLTNVTKLTPLGAMYVWDVKNRSCCIPKDISDIPLSVQFEQGTYFGNVFNVEYIKQELPDWIDQETIYHAEFGQRFVHNMEPGVVVCPMNMSVRPHLHEFGVKLLDSVASKLTAQSRESRRYPPTSTPMGLLVPTGNGATDSHLT